MNQTAIDGRWGGVRESSLEKEQTMNMAKKSG